MTALIAHRQPKSYYGMEVTEREGEGNGNEVKTMKVQAIDESRGE